ncbi:Hypothetical predicted protein [Mytilus galloprovincialis]|uniref:Kringle domain-containing protein n=1 Tax=Mytilus galloprovincialis TaxID=29158 RepID=A0A8B6HAA6_MYTGA|nr:Hypothetical predicted protein [Mytilus galloprovincialis]
MTNIESPNIVLYILILGFACGVFDSPPTRLPNTNWTVSFTNVVVVTFKCLSFKQGLSQKHCPVSSCRSDDQWSTDYNISCTNEDCFTQSTGYKGKVQCTVSGITCQNWNKNTPHVPNYQLDVSASNYCRDPSSTGRPWCYTTNPDLRWEFCPVTTC